MDNKSAKLIFLPIQPNKYVYFISDQGELMRTTPRHIDSIRYNKTYATLYVTFTTSNSIYHNVPFQIQDMPEYMDNQVIEKSASIYTDDNRIVTVNKIEEITKENIVIRDEMGDYYKSPIKVIEDTRNSLVPVG